MLSNIETTPEDTYQLKNDFERVRKECPRFMAWLAKSVNETADVLCGASGDIHWKQVGAFETLREIYGTVTHPPEAGALADAEPSGLTV